MAEGPTNRLRLVAVMGAVAVLAGSGLLLDRVVGPRAAAGGTSGGVETGAWFCPHGGALGWQAWVVVTNPGPNAAQVRMTQFAAGRAQSVASFEVPPLRQVYRAVPGDDPSDATEVEYFGGWVGAASIIRSSSPPGVAAARCADVIRRTWYLPDETTGPGETAFVVVMNPFGQDAVFDLAIKTDIRTIAPGPLSPYVLKAGGSVAFRLNDFALEGPGETTVTATVTARIGRVVAGGFVASPGGVRADSGEVQPSSRSVIPVAGFVGTPQLIVVDPGQDRADVSVVSSSSTGQRVVSGSQPISLGPGQVKTLALTGFPGTGLIVHADNDVPLVSAVRLTGPKGDPATVVGGVEPSSAWLVPPSTTSAGGKSYLVLVNPGSADVRIAVQLIGAAGPIQSKRLDSIVLPAGRTIVAGLTGPARGAPVSAVVRGQGGTFVAASASYGPSGVGYAVTLGLPMKQR